jgi:CHAT domain-containing protein/tetratricopeptide (TPR) repeat protein
VTDTTGSAHLQASLKSTRSLIEKGAYADAEKQARALLSQVEAASGANPSQVTDVLDVLVEALWRGGKAKAPESRQLAESAVASRENEVGPDGLDVANSLNNLASVLLLCGDVAKARPMYERVLRIREHHLPPDHPDVARSLVNLANIQSQEGDFTQPKGLLERALAIQAKAFGDSSIKLAPTLNNYGNLLRYLGDYAGARENLERALAIREKILGLEHPDVARTLDNLANVLYEQADYVGARPFYERALKIREKKLPADHPSVAGSLENVGNILHALGDDTNAKPLFERALASQGGDSAKDTPLVAETMSDLGLVLESGGDHAGAQRLFERALGMRERIFGPELGDDLTSLGNLADVLRRAGHDVEARAAYERQLRIQEKRFGLEHPDVAETLNNLASLLQDMGQVTSADSLYQRALAIQEKSLGPWHPTLARTLVNLARLDATHGQTKKAFDAALRTESIGRQHLLLTASALPERQALKYESVRVSGLDVVLSLAARPHREVPAWGSQAFDAIVRSRAVVLDLMAARHRIGVGAEDVEVAGLARELAAARGRLANLTVRGAQQDSLVRYRRLLDGVREEEELAERRLAAKSGTFVKKQAAEEAGVADVRAALPSGTALVAYAEYRDLPVSPITAPASRDSMRAPSGGVPRGREELGSGRVGTPAYVAFVLSPSGGDPAVVPLGSAGRIDSLVILWRTEVATAPRSLLNAKASELEYRAVAEELRRAVWDPVAAYLQSPTQVFVVPDGALNLVNLSTLPAANGQYLVETGPRFHLLSAERDILQWGRGPESQGAGLLVLGGPDFDLAGHSDGQPKNAELASTVSVSKAVGRAAASRYRGPHSACLEFRALRFEPLPGARAEAHDISKVWSRGWGRGSGSGRPGNVLELTGPRATEAAFKADAPGRKVVHLATHAFFLQGQCGWSADATSGPTESPLLLSGLALAGANARNSDSGDPTDEDGILTAEEIASADLTGVDWVVLSACETAMGTVQSGEGVLGLRRAFETAGAGTLIMSLWPVQDEATRDWMQRLYEGRAARMSTAEAVESASRKCLGALRHAGWGAHPFYWGAFVAAGDWR